MINGISANSFDHQRYKDHTLLTDDEEELGVFNRLSYNSGHYNTYESWNQVPHPEYWCPSVLLTFNLSL